MNKNILWKEYKKSQLSIHNGVHLVMQLIWIDCIFVGYFKIPVYTNGSVPGGLWGHKDLTFFFF